MKHYKMELEVGKYYRFSYPKPHGEMVNYVKVLAIGLTILKVKGYKIYMGAAYNIDGEDWDLEIEGRVAEEITEEEFETGKMMELL